MVSIIYNIFLDGGYMSGGIRHRRLLCGRYLWGGICPGYWSGGICPGVFVLEPFDM